MKSTAVFFDTNVILNYMTGRDDKETLASREMIRLCASGIIKGYMALHSVSTIWYVLRKRPAKERRQWLRAICNTLSVVGVPHESVLEAIERESFDDLEDCLVEQSAIYAGTDCILTANLKDFRYSSVPATTPSNWLANWIPD